MKSISSIHLIVFIALALNFCSCKKDGFTKDTSAQLNITADSLKFDTIFTATGSYTQSFKIKNPNDQKLLISSIQLMGGDRSSFHLNVNGYSGSQRNDIEIAAFDSIYVFVAVNIDPNNNNLPFIVTDSILIQFNNNNQFVQLEAFGQNAHFCRDIIIHNDTTWTNDLPYVILGGLTIDSNAVLTLDQGCKIFVHSNAPILVDGTLIANGEKLNEVMFTGDRLDEEYRDLPASWPGIYFRKKSIDNLLQFCIIKNATNAINVDQPSANGNPKLTAHQIIIDNASESGLHAVQSSFSIDNSLISNCGKNIVINYGGEYEFTNCTAVALSTLYQLHEDPVLELTNFFNDNGSIMTDNLVCSFNNCVLWGDGGGFDDELLITKEGSTVFDIKIENSLIKNATDPNFAILNNVIRNIDPAFDSIDIANNYFDFRINNQIASPLIDAGSSTAFSKDLDNQPRLSGSMTDIGCYEKQQ